MSPSLLEDRNLRHAVSEIELRAESKGEAERPIQTFVDPGIAAQLQNDNSQILYGRRGTGKTHLLQVLTSSIRHRLSDDRLGVYIDMRHLGSSALFVEEGHPIHVKVTGLLGDLLEALHAELLSHITDPRVGAPQEALDALDALTAAMIKTVLADETITSGESESHEAARLRELGAQASTRPSVSGHAKRTRSRTDARTQERSGRPMVVIHFRELNAAIGRVLEACGIRHMTILLDEWNTVPWDLQPLLAEFIRRAFLANPRISVKIASIEYRSNFRSETHGDSIGLELGADVSAALELDEYYIYERNPEQVTSLFSELLFRHLRTEASRQSGIDEYLTKRFPIHTAADLQDELFAGTGFTELVRAGEGVPRDFMNVFVSAYFKSVRSPRDKIDAGAIRESAEEWYEFDKAKTVDEREETILGLIVHHVVGKHQMTTFLLPKRHERNELIRSLVDLRLLHLVRRGYRPSRESPSDRYNTTSLTTACTRT